MKHGGDAGAGCVKKWSCGSLNVGTVVKKEDAGRQMVGGVNSPRVSATSSHSFFFFFITLGLELSDTKVYEP